VSHVSGLTSRGVIFRQQNYLTYLVHGRYRQTDGQTQADIITMAIPRFALKCIA